MSVLALVLDMICTFNEIFWLYQWVNVFLEKKDFLTNKFKVWWNEFILYTFYTLIVFCLNRITLTSAYTMVIIMTINLITVLCFWKGDIMQGIAIVGGYFFGLFLEGNIVISITGIIGGEELIKKTTGELGAERVLYIALGSFIWYLINRYIIVLVKQKNIKVRKNMSVAGISISGFVGSAFLGSMLVNSFSIQVSKIWYLFIVSILIVIFVGYFWIKQKEDQLRMTILSTKNEMLEKNYMQVNEFYTSNAKLYHDMNHHFDALYHLLQQGHQEQAKEYISNLRTSDNVMRMEIQSGINVLDAILCEMEKRAQKKGIEFNTEVPILPCNLGIENGDICSLFANLLDNAIEAAFKKVNMHIKYYNRTLYITIQNDYLIAPIRKNGEFVTQKREKDLHGWGTQIVKQIVQKYEGSIEYEVENGSFKVCVVINEKV